jgi:hypothetical protein
MATINAINKRSYFLTSDTGLTVTSGNTTLTPLNASGMVLNSAAGVLSTAATTQYALQVGNAAGQISSLGIGLAGQILRSAGAGADPAFTTTTYPATNAIGEVLIATAANTVTGVAGGVTAGWVLTANGAGTSPTFQASVGGGIGTLAGDSGTATGATVTIAGTASQITTTAAAATVTLSLPSAITTPGSLTTTTSLTATLGNITTTAGDHVVGNVTVANTQPILDFKKSRTGGVITTGDLLGQILFRGIGTGTTYTAGASITSTSSGTILATRVAGNLVFSTHPDSATSDAATTRMTIASNGAVTIAVPDSGTALTVSDGGISVAGGISVLSKNIDLPAITTTSGSITYKNAGGTIVPFFHNFGNSGVTNGYNLFIGQGAGNFTLTAGTARYNIGIGGGSPTTGALSALTIGLANTCVGLSTCAFVTTGSANTALGTNCLRQLTTGANNIAIGYVSSTDGAGSNYTGAESSNIVIQNLGTVGESNAIRIGTAGAGDGQQNKCFIVGIYGITTTSATTAAVLVSDGHQLGTVASSIRYKENVQDMGPVSDDIHKLRPVVFNLKSDASKTIQYGLIAEEVVDVIPRLVGYKDGEINTVHYHELPALLLNEIQKQQKTINVLAARIAALEGRLS